MRKSISLTINTICQRSTHWYVSSKPVLHHFVETYRSNRNNIVVSSVKFVNFLDKSLEFEKKYSSDNQHYLSKVKSLIQASSELDLYHFVESCRLHRNNTVVSSVKCVKFLDKSLKSKKEYQTQPVKGQLTDTSLIRNRLVPFRRNL